MRKRQPRINRGGSHRFVPFDTFTSLLTQHAWAILTLFCIFSYFYNLTYPTRLSCWAKSTPKILKWVSHSLLQWTSSTSPRREADFPCEPVIALNQQIHGGFLQHSRCGRGIISWASYGWATNLLRLPGEHWTTYCRRFWARDQSNFEEPWL